MAKMTDKRASSKLAVEPTLRDWITSSNVATTQSLARRLWEAVALGKFPIYSFPVDGHKRKEGGVLHELHLHKRLLNDTLPPGADRRGPVLREEGWMLTSVRRINPDSSNKGCQPDKCTILTVDIVTAEFLCKDDEGNPEYAWVDVSLLNKGL